MTDKLNAKLDQVKGTVKEAFGKLTDDKTIQAEGLMDKVVGKTKEVVADVKDSVDGILDELKNH